MSAFPLWREGCLYGDLSKYANSWEAYFEPVIDAAVYESIKQNAFKGVPTLRPTFFGWQNDPGQDQRQTFARLTEQYIRPIASVRQAVDSFIAEHLAAQPFLGVHVRLTDAARGEEDKKVKRAEDYFALADRWAQDNTGPIFLATDSLEAVTLFKQRYGSRVVQREAIRSSDGQSIHGHYDGGTEGDPITKGLDVLIDALILSRADHLVRGLSAVTVFALCRNPSLTFHDVNTCDGTASNGDWISAWSAPAPVVI
ncbi:MAG: hypothetical protein ACFBZ8_06980 [Opitutales bacterium]